MLAKPINYTAKFKAKSAGKVTQYLECDLRALRTQNLPCQSPSPRQKVGESVCFVIKHIANWKIMCKFMLAKNLTYVKFVRNHFVREES